MILVIFLPIFGLAVLTGLGAYQICVDDCILFSVVRERERIWLT